jgi:GNAT superfamily N-acetyltransferase
MQEFDSAGWTIREDANGKIKVHINTDKLGDLANTLPHEMFHAVFRELGMKSEFKDRINEHILGTFDANGKQIKPPSISKYEAESFFTKYINNAYTGNDKTERLAKLKQALDEYYKTGQMTVMEADGKTPVLHNLTEEFGAYYWTQFLNDKPVDYLFRGGDLGGVRNALDSVKNKWQDYMERKVGGVNGGFDFARSQYLNPSFLDANGKRIRVSALDYMMQDLIRTKSAASKGQAFDFNNLSPEGQRAYVEASGNSVAFEPPAVKGGKYKVRSEAQQAKIRAKNAEAMHKGLEAFRTSNPDILRIKDAQGNDVGGLSVDADGNYVGTVPDAILDYFVKSGHIDKVEAERIKILQKAARGETPSNVFEFTDYTGDTMHTGVGADIRAVSPNVPTKSRLVIVTDFSAKISPKDYGFYPHTLDYRHLELRVDNSWKDPKVRAAWGDDRDAFVSDLFRYFKNASLPDGQRLPSAQLWAENGEYKRNIMHDVSGVQTPAAGTINTANAPIAGDMFSTFRKFRTDRMTQERMSGEKIDLRGDNAIDYIRHNMMPSEMSGETTPNGKIWTHPSGYKFLQVQGGIKAVKPDGTIIGKFTSMEEAVKRADVIYQKENPNSKPIASVDNIRNEPADAPETQAQYAQRKIDTFYERPENALDLLNSKEFENFFEKKGAFTLDRLKVAIKNIIDDANKPNQGDRFATDFIDYPIEGDYILEEYLSQDFPKAKTIGDVFKEYFKDQYFREQEANNPTFVSGLSVALDKIIPANVNKEGTIQASRLLNQMKNASGGDIGKILTESNAIGFTDWLKSKGQTRVSETEIRQYIQDNGIKVSIDPRTDIRGNEWMGGGFDTSRYVAEGKKDGYYTFVARINPEQAHGVEGHFGGDTIAHIRATIRTDAQGRKVLFIEEIQSINTHAGVLTPEARVKAIEEYRQLKKWDEASTNFKEEVAGVRAKYKEKISEGAKELRESFSSVISETPEQEKARSKYYRDRLFKLYAEKINDYRKVWEIYKDKIEPKFKEKVEKEIKIRKKRYGSSLERDITLDFFYNFDSELSHGKILNFSDYTRKISEVESRLAKKKSDKPLQDFNETVKIASRTIMRKAVELGADRVVLVRPEDMHPDVSKNAEGERFVDAAYGRDIPMMMDAELKKYGQKLEPARNYNLSKELNVPFSERENNQTRTTKAILSESLGYDITPEMKQKAGRSQTFMMPSEGEQGGRKYSSKELKGSFIGKQAQEKPELTDGIKLSYRSWDTEEGATEGRKLIILTRSSDGAEIGRIDFDYTNLTKHGMKSRGFGDKDGIVVDGISVNVNKRFQGKGYQHILYSEMYERARAMGATGFSQEIENAKGLPLKSVNKVIGESNHSIASLSEPTAQKPTQENFNRLIENAPAIESNYHSNLPSVQNWGKIDPNARYMPAEENVNYKGKQLKIVEPSETELRNAGTGTFSGGYYTERKNLNINNIAPATTINLNSSEQSKIYNIVKSIKSSNGHIERLIVDKDGKIIEGGHRYLALKQLGITNVPVVQLIEKSSLLKNYNSILSEFSNVSNLHPEQSRQMLEHAVDIIKEDGISGLDNSEMPKPFEQNWNKLKDIIKSKEVSTDTKNMMPAEGEYRSGDNYWKAKDNKFEGVDENGQTYRLAYAVVNGKTEYHPDFVSWLDIGHGSGNSKDIKRFGLWGENPTNIKENGKFNKDEIITKPLGNNFVGDHQNWFEKEFKYTEEEPKTMGRYELPVYDSKGKLVTRGRISITDKELQRSMSSFKSIKERVCKKLKIKSEDVDAYIFGGRIQANEELGISHKDQLPIKFMPAEGKQSKKTYTDTEFKGSLIGAYAKEHEFLTKDLNINVELSKPAKDYNYLYVHLSKENGDNVGGMAVHIYPDREMAKVYNTSIKPDYQGRGYGNLLYSEVFERLRSLGIKSVKGEMADKQGRPAMIRKSVAGKTTVSSSGLLNTELKSNRNYMPAEQAEAWRKFQSEKVSDDNSIFKNAMNYVIIQANNKYKVYNPQKALLGIYTDLDQAKRRVQREEPKQR